MIYKVQSRKNKSFYQLLSYLANDKGRLFDSKGLSFCITHNLKGRTLKHLAEAFKQNEKNRINKRKDSVILTHEILSFHKEDNLSMNVLHDIATEYIRLRGSQGMYFIVPHSDKNHKHLHVMASALEYKTGKSMRMTKAQFATLKKDIENYQRTKYPELTHSRVNHGKSRKADKEYQMKVNGRTSDKEKLTQTLKTLATKATNTEQFHTLITKAGLKLYERNGKITGIYFNDFKYRLSRLDITKELESLQQADTRKTTERKSNKERSLER